MYNEAKQRKIKQQNMLYALKQLQQDLRGLGTIPHNVEEKEVLSMWHGGNIKVHVPRDNAIFDYAVKFFDTITKFQDTGIFEANLFPNNKVVQNLGAHINNCGRCEYGVVRSKKGEPITKDNLWLSMTMFGSNTLSMAQWEKAWAENPKYNEFYKSVYQLWMYDFVKSNMDKMAPLFDSILQQDLSKNNNALQAAKNKLIHVLFRGKTTSK